MSEHAGKGLTRRPKVDSPRCAAKAREPKHNTGRAGLPRPPPLKGGHDQRGHPCRAICVRHVHPTGTQNGDPAEAGPTARGREDQCLRSPGRLMASPPPRHLSPQGQTNKKTQTQTETKRKTTQNTQEGPPSANTHRSGRPTAGNPRWERPPRPGKQVGGLAAAT